MFLGHPGIDMLKIMAMLVVVFYPVEMEICFSELDCIPLSTKDVREGKGI